MRALAIAVLVGCSSPAPPRIVPPPPPPAVDAAPAVADEIAAGAFHTCALRGGTVWCWGDDEFGQVSGTPAYLALAPVVVARGATAIAAGRSSTCAVLADGVRCWGSEKRWAGKVVPARFTGERARGLHVDGDASCAITPAGGVRCITDDDTAFDVRDVRDAVQLAAGCALTAGGDLACWDTHGAARVIAHDVVSVGGSDTRNRCFATRDGAVRCGNPLTAAPIAGLTDAVEVAVHRTTACARRRDGRVACWHDDDPPHDIAGVAGATAITVGRDHACALVPDGARCWGDDALGQLARAPSHLHALRDPIPNLPPATDLAAWPEGACALSGDGASARWTCWGGSLPWPPVAPDTGYDGLTALVYPWQSMCAIRADRKVVCSGENTDGAVGDGTTARRDKPFVVPGPSDVVELAAGYTHVCARSSTGRVWCWGNNGSGQLGPSIKGERAKPVAVATGVTRMFLHDNATCLAHASAPIQCFGDVGRGVDLAWLPTAKVIRAAESSACAILADDSVSCFGYNQSGTLGDGTTTNEYTQAHAALGLAHITDLAGPCALGADGSVWCWGHRDRALGLGGSMLDDCNLGDGPPWPCVRTPTRLPIENAVQLVAGDRTTCVRLRDGSVRCWGERAGWPEPPDEPAVAIALPSP